MSQLALQLIEKEKQERTGKLDLGNCGLTNEIPKELFDCTWLEELSFSNSIWDTENKKWISPNKGIPNRLNLTELPKEFENLQNLKRLIISSGYSTVLKDSIYYNLENCSIIEKLTGLQSLDLSNNQISDISFIKNLTGLKAIFLSYNQISDISFIKDLTSLQSLYLSANQIRDISFIKDLTSLQSLYLRTNNIDDISFVKNLTGLQLLSLRANQISDISFIKNLTGLESLDLGVNYISDISFLKNLTGLKQLDLSYNQISDYSFLKNLTELQTLNIVSSQISDISFIKDLTRLQSLDLGNNQISNYSFLKGLTGLQKLDLGSNQINDISSIKDLTGLQELDLQSNQISDISFIKNLTRLQKLNLDSNHISNTGFIKNLTGLQVLSLHANQISNINFLKYLTKLQVLDLSNNQINDISLLKGFNGLQSLKLGDNQINDYSVLKSLIGLQNLDLCYNKIADYSFLSNMTELQALYLRNNQISNINFLKYLTKLQVLDLSNNQINDISLLNGLTGLQELDLRFNQISIITPIIQLLKNGVEIKNDYFEGGVLVKGNPITTPPIGIIEQGREKVINWFEQVKKQGGYEKLYEAKLIIVGEPGAGKTTLMKKLINPEYNINSDEAQSQESTVGINIYEGWAFPFFNEKQQNFNCNIWDFGGQVIQYMTHQFFLTPSALYVLVADDRKQHTNFPYWFETINLLGKEDGYQSPILVILNENKHKSITNFDYHYYVNKYEKTEIKQIEVDLSKSDTRYYNMLEQLQKLICNLKHVGDEVPKQWKPIREDLRELSKTKNHITEREFFAICEKNKVPKEEHQLLISTYLHKLGAILHFKEDKTLRNFIVLNPQWAVDAVYGVLENSEVNDKAGRFDENLLNTIWTKYQRDEKFNLLNLMKREAFEICYEFKQGEYVAAQLLSTKRPQINWANENSLKFRFRYKFMPKGIITRFIVRRNNDIVHDDNDKPLVWNKGVIIKNDACKALVEEDINNEGLKIIDIAVTGEINERKYLLRIIREEIEAIHKKWFKNVEYQPMVPCICEDCKNAKIITFFEYDELTQYRNEGEREIKCKNKKIKSVNVLELLEGVYQKEELYKHKDMENTDNGLQSQKIDFHPEIHVYAEGGKGTATASSESKAEATANVEISIEIQNILDQTDLLKEDIEDEREVLQKEMDDSEINTVVKKLERIEKEMEALKSTQNAEPKSKTRFQQFVDDMENKDSKLNKVFRLLSKGKDYGIQIAELYNKVAQNTGLPSVPPLAIEAIKKL